MTLLHKIKAKQAKVGIVGFGYVGLPLAEVFCDAGFHVTGIDVSEEKVRQINEGISYIPDVPSEVVKNFVDKGLLCATTDFSVIRELDAINVCVPTPLRKTKDPDVSFIVAAMEEVVKYLHPEMLIVLESTTYPGTTSELVLPMLEEGGLSVGKDFHLAFSPERVDPGNKIFTTKNVPKVVGGMTKKCTQLAIAYYKQALPEVVPVSSTDVAEMVKLLENTFRSVNIGLVNEIALMCRRMGVDVWEVIDAAATKPFGFMPFYPGPGLGGHCIPIDPFYLSWKARASGFEARFIQLAGEINSSMPAHVVTLIGNALNGGKKCIKGSKILILGVAYKADIDDLRESPALDIMEFLRDKQAKIFFSDPHVPEIDFHGKQYHSIPLTPSRLKQFDCAVIVTGHKAFDYKMIVKYSQLVVDTRNALKGIKNKKIVRM